MGKLRHVAIILPCTKSLFLPINKALKGDPIIVVLGKSSKVRSSILDLAAMIILMAERPTHVKDMIPNEDHY